MALEFPAAPGVLLILGGAILVTLALLHALFTLQDIATPRRLVPEDPAVQEAMARSGMRLSRGATSMWRAWIGFNLSHSLGVLLFGGGCIALGVELPGVGHPGTVLLLPVGIGLCYLALALRYWFRVPAFGAGIAVGAFGLAWLLVVA